MCRSPRPEAEHQGFPGKNQRPGLLRISPSSGFLLQTFCGSWMRIPPFLPSYLLWAWDFPFNMRIKDFSYHTIKFSRCKHSFKKAVAAFHDPVFHVLDIGRPDLVFPAGIAPLPDIADQFVKDRY